MFDESDPRSRREVIARFDALAQQMVERWQHPTPDGRVLRTWMEPASGPSGRVGEPGAAEQLVAIGELFGHRLSRCSETEDWAIDTMDGGGRRGGRGVADQPRPGR